LAISEIRNLHSKTGNNFKLLTVDILDSNNDEIECNFYDTEAEIWSKNLKEGQIYEFSHGQIKMKLNP